MADNNELAVKVTAEGTEEAEGGIQGLVSAIGGITGSIGSLMSFLPGVGAAIAAAFSVDKIEEVFNQVAELGAEVEHTAEKLGISTEEVGAFQFAAGAMGVSAQGASMSLVRLARAMDRSATGTGPAVAAFRALGISVTDGNGQLRSLDDILPEIADSFAATANGPAKMAVALTLMGRAGTQMIPFLNRGREGLEEFKKIAQDTGTVMTDSTAKGFEDSEIKSYTLGQAISGLEIAFATKLKPAIDAATSSLTKFIELTTRVISGGDADQKVLDNLTQQYTAIQDAIKKTEDAEAASAKDHPWYYPFLGGAADADFKAQLEEQAAEIKAQMDAMQAKIDAASPKKKDDKPQMQDPGVLQQQLKDAQTWAEAKLAVDKEVMESKKQELEAEVQAGQITQAQLVAQLTQYTNAAYAEEQRTLQQGMASDATSASQKLTYYAKLYELAVKHQTDLAKIQATGNKAQQTLDAEWVEFQKTQDTAALTAKRDELQQEVQAGNISGGQKIAQLKTATDAVYQSTRMELEYWMSLYASGTDLALKYYKDIEALDTKHQLDMKKIDDQAAKAQEQTEKQLTNTISSDFDSMFRQMISKNETFKQSMQQLFSNLAISAIEYFAKMAIQWAVREAFRLTVTEATNAKIDASNALSGAATSGGAAAESGLKAMISGDAGKAAAGVYANVAQIPYVGWILAPIAAAAAFAAVLAFGSGVGSFDVGAYDLSSDQLAMVHKNEMIIPANMAEGIRSGLGGSSDDSSGGGGGGGGGGNPIAITFSISALDGQSVANLLKSQGGTIADAIVTQIRNANTGLSGALKAASGSSS